MSDNNVIVLLERHTEMLSDIKIDVAVLKARESISVEQYTKLENRVALAEKLIIYSWAVTAVILAKLGLPYLLK